MRISDWSSDVCSSDLPCCRSRLSNSACRSRANIGSLAVAIEQLRGLPLQTAFRQKSFGDMAKVAWKRFAPLPICGSGRNCGTCSSRSEEHTSELQSLMRNSYAVLCLKQKTIHTNHTT